MTEQSLPQYEANNGSAAPDDIWRNEVQDRLERYKRRRGRRIEGAYTMRFPFPADEVMEAASCESNIVPEVDAAQNATEPELHPEAAAAEQLRDEVAVSVIEEVVIEDSAPPSDVPVENDLVLQSPPAEDEEPAIFVDPIPRPRPKRKVIAFPRQATVAPEELYRLADPVTAEVPRILDVPEELQAIASTPFLDGLQLDLPDPSAEAASREHVDLPWQPARVSQRMFAGLIDLAVAAAGTAVASAVAYKIMGEPALSKALGLGVVAGAVVVWTSYHYLFVVHAGKTLGMMAARVRFSTFKGKAPGLRQRRNRVLGLFLSSLSLGMGLMWAFVDVDGLCWHDRLSHTYMAERD
jgi:uncharacterized RDD family membrane protein YckC